MSILKNIFLILITVSCTTIERHHGHAPTSDVKNLKSAYPGGATFTLGSTSLSITSTYLVTPLLAGVIIPIIPTPFCWNSLQRLSRSDLSLGILTSNQNGDPVTLDLSKISLRNPQTNQVCKPSAITELEGYRRHKLTKYMLKFNCKIKDFLQYELSGLTVITNNKPVQFSSTFEIKNETLFNVYFDTAPGICPSPYN